MKIEISIGEIVDKLSILQIKKNNIEDVVKLENINKEYDYLNDVVFNELKIERINIKQITGSTEDDERKIIKKEFNNPSSALQAIIATPQSSAESISLHKDCQNAIYYDLNFNAAQFIQSLDRIHRVGGSEEKEVNYNFLHYEDSIDIKIYKRVFEKADLQMQVIEDDNSIFSIPDEDEKYADLYM